MKKDKWKGREWKALLGLFLGGQDKIEDVG